MSIEINVYNDTERKFLPMKKLEKVIERVLIGENVSDASINLALVDDENIHRLNAEYLTHDYATDVISFVLSDEGESPLEGEIYVSVDTAELQAQEYEVSLTNELSRLAAHGALHIVGHDDASDELRARMTELEDKYIQ